jgi:anti-sigma factor RsiW
MGSNSECDHDEQMTMLMSFALDDKLNSDGKRRLQRHLQTCPWCRSEWESMQQVSALFEHSSMVGPPLGFAVRVERQIDDKVKMRRRAFGGVAVLTSSLSLAGMTVSAIALVVLGLVTWSWLGSMPAVQQGTSSVAQIASGMALMGKGAGFLLKDLLLRYGPPVVLLLAIGLASLSGMWVWLFVKRPGKSHRNRYA